MEISKEEIKEMASIYIQCLKAVKDGIPRNFLGEEVHLLFSAEDYRTMATSVMIAYNDQFKGKGTGGGGPRGYSGPSTVPQQKHIGEMAMMGPKNESIISNFLETNGKKSAEELSKSEASSLIDLLHAENPRRT